MNAYSFLLCFVVFGFSSITLAPPAVRKAKVQIYLRDEAAKNFEEVKPFEAEVAFTEDGHAEFSLPDTKGIFGRRIAGEKVRVQASQLKNFSDLLAEPDAARWVPRADGRKSIGFLEPGGKMFCVRSGKSVQFNTVEVNFTTSQMDGEDLILTRERQENRLRTPVAKAKIPLDPENQHFGVPFGDEGELIEVKVVALAADGEAYAVFAKDYERGSSGKTSRLTYMKVPITSLHWNPNVQGHPVEPFGQVTSQTVQKLFVNLHKKEGNKASEAIDTNGRNSWTMTPGEVGSVVAGRMTLAAQWRENLVGANKPLAPVPAEGQSWAITGGTDCNSAATRL